MTANLSYYDPQGEPGSRQYRIEDLDERRVALTVGLTWAGRPAQLSTVLLCMPVMQGPALDRPFETQICTEGGKDAPLVLRYATRQAAEATHRALAKLLANPDAEVLEEFLRACESAAGE